MKNIKEKVSLNLYTKLLGFLTKKGNKLKSKVIIDTVFLNLSKLTKRSTSFLLYLLFQRLNIFVESKIIRIKRRTHIVPFSVSLKRRSYLVAKWIVLALVENNKKVSVVEKIQEEIVEILKGSNLSKALKLRLNNNKQALANRANMHYRW